MTLLAPFLLSNTGVLSISYIIDEIGFRISQVGENCLIRCKMMTKYWIFEVQLHIYKRADLNFDTFYLCMSTI